MGYAFGTTRQAVARWVSDCIYDIDEGPRAVHAKLGFLIQ